MSRVWLSFVLFTSGMKPEVFLGVGGSDKFRNEVITIVFIWRFERCGVGVYHGKTIPLLPEQTLLLYPLASSIAGNALLTSGQRLLWLASYKIWHSRECLAIWENFGI